MLSRQLRPEIRVAEIRVIEVIEGRIAITLFIERIDTQVNKRIRTEREEDTRSELRGIDNRSHEDRCLNAEIILYIECRSGRKPM